MNIIFPLSKLHNLTKSNRIRTICDVTINSMKTNDKENDIYYLEGRVVIDSEPFSDDVLVRFTKTSPIVSYENNTVTTASGSKYTLENFDMSVFELHPEYLNPWISGDNWITK